MPSFTELLPSWMWMALDGSDFLIRCHGYSGAPRFDRRFICVPSLWFLFFFTNSRRRKVVFLRVFRRMSLDLVRSTAAAVAIATLFGLAYFLLRSLPIPRLFLLTCYLLSVIFIFIGLFWSVDGRFHLLLIQFSIKSFRYWIAFSFVNFVLVGVAMATLGSLTPSGVTPPFFGHGVVPFFFYRFKKKCTVVSQTMALQESFAFTKTHTKSNWNVKAQKKGSKKKNNARGELPLERSIRRSKNWNSGSLCFLFVWMFFFQIVSNCSQFFLVLLSFT